MSIHKSSLWYVVKDAIKMVWRKETIVSKGT